MATRDVRTFAVPGQRKAMLQPALQVREPAAPADVAMRNDTEVQARQNITAVCAGAGAVQQAITITGADNQLQRMAPVVLCWRVSLTNAATPLRPPPPLFIRVEMSAYARFTPRHAIFARRVFNAGVGLMLRQYDVTTLTSCFARPSRRNA